MRQSLLCAVILLTMCLADNSAANAIEDPRQACEALAQIIGEDDADKLADTIVSDSRGGMRGAGTAAQQITIFAKTQGSFRFAEFMVDREYGQRFKRFWYLVLFDGVQPFYLLCDYIRPDDSWQLVNLKFNTQFEELPAP